MTIRGWNPLFLLISLCLNFGSAAALSEPQICYVLDGILFLYGIILTVLYCRIKISTAKGNQAGKSKPNAEEGIYSGLAPHPQDTYETIGMKK